MVAGLLLQVSILTKFYNEYTEYLKIYLPQEYRVSLQLGDRMASLYQGLVVLG